MKEKRNPQLRSAKRSVPSVESPVYPNATKNGNTDVQMVIPGG